MVEKPVPTFEETVRARQVYLDGMKFHYPEIDPRISLLGMQDEPHSYLYKTKAYGHDLVSIPPRWKQHLEDFVLVVGTFTTINLIIQAGIWIYQQLF